MKQNLAPMFAARVMLRDRVDDETVVDELRSTFGLDLIDARAAVAAAHVLARL